MNQRSWLPEFSTSIISAQLLLGGIVRVSPWPFRAAHEQVLEKNSTIAPLVYPLVPFKDAIRHTRWVGSWFVVTGLALALPQTRGSIATLGLVLFWTGILAYSDRKANLPYWLPVCNAVLACAGWWARND